MNSVQRKEVLPGDLVKLVYFSDPDIDGNYFSEADYAMLYGLAPNIQYAFEELNKAVAEGRKPSENGSRFQ